MADLHISHPRAKVARRWFFQDYFHFNLTFMNSTVFRNVNNDVAEAMNLSALEGLEERFSHQVKLHPVPPCILNQFFSGCNKCKWGDAFTAATVAKAAFKTTSTPAETFHTPGWVKMKKRCLSNIVLSGTEIDENTAPASWFHHGKISTKS